MMNDRLERLRALASTEFGIMVDEKTSIAPKPKKTISRTKLIRFIKKNDSFYSDLDFVGYTTEELLEVKAKVESKISSKRK